MKISPHFDVAEFAQPARHGIAGQPYPIDWIGSRLVPLCEQLEILREHLARPLKITSGYRSEAYNKRISGARNSQHVQGRAADIVVAGWTAEAVHGMALDLYKAGKLKIGGLGLYSGFVHIDIRPSTIARLARWTGSRAA